MLLLVYRGGYEYKLDLVRFTNHYLRKVASQLIIFNKVHRLKRRPENLSNNDTVYNLVGQQMGLSYTTNHIMGSEHTQLNNMKCGAAIRNTYSTT